VVNLAAYFLTAVSLMCCFFPNVLADAGSIVDHSPVVESKSEVSLDADTKSVVLENIEGGSSDAK
jgi:hypothetical protein